MNDCESIHSISSENKKLVWGDGPWVNEPDEVRFTIKGVKCEIYRQGSFRFSDVLESNLSSWKEYTSANPDCNILKSICPIWGGYLCGYICIPKDHPWYEKSYGVIDADAHGGLTYSEMRGEEYWIGFDCAHSFDIVPSMEKSYKEDPRIAELREKYPLSCVLNKSYKDISFVTEELEKLVDQAIKAK